MSDISFLYKYVALVSLFAGLLFLGMPSEYSLITDYDLALLVGEIIGVAGACIVSTGLPCAGALVILGLTNFLTYIVFTEGILKIVFFTPLTITFIYIIVKLGRGTG